MNDVYLNKSTSDAACKTCICFNVKKATRTITQIFDDIYRPLGLRSGQVSILMSLSALEKCTIFELAELICLDRTSLSRNLTPIEKLGLIDIQAGTKDKRTKVLKLSPKGENILAEAYELWKKAQINIVNVIGAETKETLIHLLNSTNLQLRQKNTHKS